MSNEPVDETHVDTPAWLNAAAVIALVVFVAGGYFTLRHFSKGDDSGSGSDRASFGSATSQPSNPRLMRAAEHPERLIFTDPDITDASEFLKIAERDPKAAAAVIARMGDTETRDERLFELMQIWIQTDPTQAADWVSGLPVGSLKTDSTTELGLAWAKADPAAASVWVEENIFTQNAPAGAASVTSSWAKSDIEAATDWVGNLDADAPARREAMRALAYKLGELDPQRGIAWLDRLKPKDKRLVLVNFATSWSDLDPSAAAAWLRYGAKGIDQGTRDQATLAVIHSWSATDNEAAAASSWIDGLSDGRLKESAKAMFAETHAETSASESFPWALSIKDPERRQEVSMIVLEEWVEQDMPGFQEAMRERWESLDESMRHEIYDLLLDHDPEFKKELFQMLEDRDSTDDP